MADSIVLVLNGKALDPDCPGLNPGSTAYRLYDMDDRASGSVTPGCLIWVPASKWVLFAFRELAFESQHPLRACFGPGVAPRASCEHRFPLALSQPPALFSFCHYLVGLEKETSHFSWCLWKEENSYFLVFNALMTHMLSILFNAGSPMEVSLALIKSWNWHLKAHSHQIWWNALGSSFPAKTFYDSHVVYRQSNSKLHNHIKL